MKSTSDVFKGRKCIQIVVDRFYRAGEPPSPIKGRILKDWKDRMPNWQPDSKGDYPNDYYYGGNLKGVEEKLSYIKGMGFDMIYLSPLDKSLEYHHYDVGDQSEIDPWFGTWDDLESLCTAAKKLGIVVIVDVVFNHTSCNSIYVKTHPEWYKKDENGNPVPWYGFKHLYEIDTANPSYISEMKKILRKYIVKGKVHGFRYDLGMNLAREFLLEMATLKKEFPYILFVLEMWEIATSRSDPKIFDGQTDSVMNYPMTDAILRWCAFGNAEHFKYNFKRVYTEYPETVQKLLLNNIATHDTPLTMTMLADIKLRGNQPIMNPDVFKGAIWDIEDPWRSSRGFDTYGFRLFEAEHDKLTPTQYELAFKLSRVAFALMYSIRGIPCVMQGADIGDTGFKDPFCRKPYDWFNPNLSMQSYIATLNKIYEDNVDVFADGDSNLASCNDGTIILERFDYSGHRIVTAVSRFYRPMQIWIKNDCSNLNVIYATDGSTKQRLAPYGVLIAREN